MEKWNFSHFTDNYSNLNVFKESQLPSFITFALKTFYSTLCPSKKKSTRGENDDRENKWNGKLCTSFSPFMFNRTEGRNRVSWGGEMWILWKSDDGKGRKKKSMKRFKSWEFINHFATLMKHPNIIHLLHLTSHVNPLSSPSTTPLTLFHHRTLFIFHFAPLFTLLVFNFLFPHLLKRAQAGDSEWRSFASLSRCLCWKIRGLVRLDRSEK